MLSVERATTLWRTVAWWGVKKLTIDSLKTLVQAFILSRLDMQNALYSGLPNSLLDKLQRVQNSAPRLISGWSCRAHITPVLKDWHWLPVRQRISFKLCVVIYGHDELCTPVENQSSGLCYIKLQRRHIFIFYEICRAVWQCSDTPHRED